MEVEEILIENIEVKEQPRQIFEGLTELGASIKKLGLLQPILVSKEKEKYKLISGERRLKVFKLLKKKKIPCIIRDGKDFYLSQLAENTARENLTIMEEAEALARILREKYGSNFFKGFTQIRAKAFDAKLLDSREKEIKSIIDALGITLARAEELIKITSLPDEIKEKVGRSRNSFGLDYKTIPFKHAVQLTRLSSVESQKKIAEKITEDKMNFDYTKTMVSFAVDEEKTKAVGINWTKKDMKDMLNAFLRVEYNTKKLIRNYDYFLKNLYNVRNLSIEKLKDSHYYLNQFADKYKKAELVNLIGDLLEKHKALYNAMKIQEQLKPKVQIQEKALDVYLIIFAKIGYAPFNSSDVKKFGLEKNRFFDSYIKSLKVGNLIFYELDYENQSCRIYHLQPINFPIKVSGQRGVYTLYMDKFQKLLEQKEKKLSVKQERMK